METKLSEIKPGNVVATKSGPRKCLSTPTKMVGAEYIYVMESENVKGEKVWFFFEPHQETARVI